MYCSEATQSRWLRADGGRSVLINILNINFSQISETDSEIQSSKATDGNITSICVVNVSICIHLDCCKAKTFIGRRLSDSALDEC